MGGAIVYLECQQQRGRSRRELGPDGVYRLRRRELGPGADDIYRFTLRPVGDGELRRSSEDQHHLRDGADQLAQPGSDADARRLPAHASIASPAMHEAAIAARTGASTRRPSPRAGHEEQADEAP